MNQGGTEYLLLVSHLRLRRIVGALGLALPVILLVWGFALSGWSLTVQNSLSDYYSLRTRDAFVGILFVIAWFLCTYKGYEVVDDVPEIWHAYSRWELHSFPTAARAGRKSCTSHLLPVFFWYCHSSRCISSPRQKTPRRGGAVL